MWSSRLFWHLIVAYSGISLVSTSCFVAVVSGWQTDLITEQVEKRLYDTAVVYRSHVAEHVQSHGVAGLQDLTRSLAEQTGTRMTLVAGDGVVLADSEEEPARMENHKDRPELIQAEREGVGQSERISPTLTAQNDDRRLDSSQSERNESKASFPELVYLALRCDDGLAVRYVRVALHVSSIHNQVRKIQRLIWTVAAMVVLFTLAFTYFVVGQITRPLATLTDAAESIARGELHQRVFVSSRNELGTLADAFNRMSDELAKRIKLLTRNGEQLGAVLGSMDEGVVAVDRSERIMLANEAAGRLLEFAPNECAERPLLELVRNPQVHEIALNTLDGEDGDRAEVETFGSARRSLAVRATRLPGDPTRGVVLVFDDITELRRLENLRREFVANVSHELKTPLASIKAYTETLKLGAINDPEHNLQFVEQIEKQSDRLHQLIMDLLQLTRIESEQEVFDITAASIAEAVEACVAAHRQAADAKQIVITVEADKNATHVRADEEGLRTILDNLVDNAIKYTPVGGQVCIRWERQHKGVLMEVKDTGIGIAEKHHARIFERFYRVDKARSRQLGGTGLGLSIVKHLAQAFGGSVGLASEPGHGCTFSVRLHSAA